MRSPFGGSRGGSGGGGSSSGSGRGGMSGYGSNSNSGKKLYGQGGSLNSSTGMMKTTAKIEKSGKREQLSSQDRFKQVMEQKLEQMKQQILLKQYEGKEMSLTAKKAMETIAAAKAKKEMKAAKKKDAADKAKAKKDAAKKGVAANPWQSAGMNKQGFNPWGGGGGVTGGPAPYNPWGGGASNTTNKPWNPWGSSDD